ncbi:MAG: fibro-slime domain-containing protein [Polyangiaceae bacterium]|nr:fibro-slime domain-containing protein [Polyangiaceae bacterium]
MFNSVLRACVVAMLLPALVAGGCRIGGLPADTEKDPHDGGAGGADTDDQPGGADGSEESPTAGDAAGGKRSAPDAGDEGGADAEATGGTPEAGQNGSVLAGTGAGGSAGSAQTGGMGQSAGGAGGEGASAAGGRAADGGEATGGADGGRSTTGGNAAVGGSSGAAGSPNGGQSTGGSAGGLQCRFNGVTEACLAVCGDGNRDPAEGCDDGNLLDRDGCSSSCTVETGFVCTDHKQSAARPCPSNPSLDCLVLPVTYRDFDGQQEPTGHPDFFYYGAPTSSPSPVGHSTGVSPGATKTTCVPNASGTRVDWSPADGCPTGDADGPCLGIAQSTLGANGKPLLGTSSCPCSFTDWEGNGFLGSCSSSDTCTPLAGLSGVAECYVVGDGSHRLRIDTTVRVVESDMSFAQWYTDSSCSTAIQGTLELAATSDGQYQFSSSTPGAPAGAAGSTISDDIHAIFMGTQTSLTSGFFPLEIEARPKICNIWPYWIANPSCMAGGEYPVINQWDPLGSYVARTPGTGGPVAPVVGVPRNFYFTTEAHYLFRYDGVGGTVTVKGDDDVWVFINGRLAIDLGGPHVQTELSATINASYGLTADHVYDLALFHADRHPRDSNFQLSLPDFGVMRSVCQPE